MKHSIFDPFLELRFIPTDGSKLENATQYLQHPRIYTIGGSWMARRPMIAEGGPELSAALARTPAGEREALLRLSAAYLHATIEADAGSDPVAKFHLHNGAQLARLNFLANPSPRGLRESFGLMVNYLYDLRHIERNHERFVHGRIAAAREVTRLL